VTLLTLIVTLPYWGLTGAAVSTLFGHLASLAVRLVWYTRTVSRIAVRELIPSLPEIKEWVQTGLGAVRETARKWRRKPSVLER
jgi:Na+-driven multidrug efflux pump